jgi:hypothetical protein
MTINYTLLVEVDDVGLLSAPFHLTPPTPALYDRVWIDRDSFGRGFNLNRYSGEVEYFTQPPGFGIDGFGDGIFGWS